VTNFRRTEAIVERRAVSHDKIRLAYLSADFHDHATAYLMAELFERHDRQQFETWGISFGRDEHGEMRSRLMAGFDQFIDVRATDDAGVARLLREHEIDIAIDLKGYTEGARPGILAHRPAPIQVNYLGYPGTMGAPYIDYIIADEFVIPISDRAHYSEQVVYLADCYQVNDSKRKVGERTPARSESDCLMMASCFAASTITTRSRRNSSMCGCGFCDESIGSVLWLLRGRCRGCAATCDTRPRLAASIPIGWCSRRRVPLDEHLARHRLADLFLDTLPYNAHTTASDALWAGLPVLTCPGTGFAGRVAGSLLRAINLPELITNSIEEYEALAFELAAQPARLGDIKSKLARNRLVSRCSTPTVFDETSRPLTLLCGMLASGDLRVRFPGEMAKILSAIVLSGPAVVRVQQLHHQVVRSIAVVHDRC
jgi:predicted O-linked N-acetylglucosamine transferase (SPINDLY family)